MSKKFYEKYPLIKICGLTRKEDVALCLSLGVNLTGFIFAHESPRYIEPQKVASMPSGNAARVGVFVNENKEIVIETMKAAQLDFAQLHGQETPDFCKYIGAKHVIKVFWPDSYASIKEFQDDCEAFAPYCAMFLLDAGTSGGGHGKSLHWEKLRDLRLPRPWLLAGGLTPENVKDAVTSCEQESFCGLDISSGVESAPGVKDANALAQIMHWRSTIEKPTEILKGSIVAEK